jgi:uncharacterized damage-inducible protein DinB
MKIPPRQTPNPTPECRVPIADSLLPEFDHEMATTRRVLERVPEADAAWAPHARSMTLGRLASHVAEIPGWVGGIVGADSLDAAPVGGAPYRIPGFESRAALLEQFDRNVASARAAIAGASDERLREPWSLKRAGETLFTLPRTAVLRTFFMNHLIHHRGQLTVYLRLRDVPLPIVYGDSADSPMGSA